MADKSGLAAKLISLGLVPSAVAPAAAAANTMLAPYGLQMPDQSEINPNVFFPNTGFFGNHPRITNALEGALMGAAFTRPSNTAGEAINNIAQGLLQSRDYRQNNLLRQYMAPFAMAGQLGNLQQVQDAHQTALAQQDYYRRFGNYYNDLPEVRREAARDRLLGMYKPNGPWKPNMGLVRKFMTDPDSMTPDELNGIWEYDAKAAGRSGVMHIGPYEARTSGERAAATELAESLDKGGEMWDADTWNQRVYHHTTRLAGGVAGAGAGARNAANQAAGDLPEDLRVQVDETNRSGNTNKWDANSKPTFNRIRSEVLSDPRFANVTDMAEVNAEINRRIQSHNDAIDADTKQRTEQLKSDYWNHRGRAPIAPRSATPPQKAPRQVASAVAPKGGKPVVSVDPNGTISISRQ